MGKFSHRSSEEEIMDDLDVGGELINQTLRELETINRLLGGNHVSIKGIEKLIDPVEEKVWRILDLGCGGGDILKLIARWARKNSVKVELIGIDANPHVVAFAERNCIDFPEIRFESINIFSEEFRELECDIITGTLFFHHFSNEELVSFFSHLKEQATRGIVINDIHRHWFAYYSINLLTSLFSKSTMVKNDAGVSVLRSFRKADWRDILKNSGIQNYSLRWMWAFRWQIISHST